MSERPGRSSADQARIKKLEHENKELRIASEILKKAWRNSLGRRTRAADRRLNRMAPLDLRRRGNPMSSVDRFGRKAQDNQAHFSGAARYPDDSSSRNIHQLKRF